MFPWAALGAALRRLGCVDLAIFWRGAGFQELEGLAGDSHESIKRCYECGFIRLGRFLESADLSHNLQCGSANFGFSIGGRVGEEGIDVAAHDRFLEVVAA